MAMTFDQDSRLIDYVNAWHFAEAGQPAGDVYKEMRKFVNSMIDEAAVLKQEQKLNLYKIKFIQVFANGLTLNKQNYITAKNELDATVCLGRMFYGPYEIEVKTITLIERI